MDNPTIIQIAADDDNNIDQIVAMTTAFSAESHIYERMKFNPAKCREYIKAHTKPGAAVYAAVKDGIVLGYAILAIDKQYIDEANFEIITIYVPKEHRKTGAGRALAEALVETMDLNRCKYGQISICCAMKEDEELINKLTANMFKKLGFYQIGIIMGRRGLSWES